MATERVGRPRRRFLRFKLRPLIVRVLLFGGIIGLIIGRAEQHDRATHAEMQRAGRWIGCESERWAPETRGTADPFDRRWLTDVVIYIYPSDAPGAPFPSATALSDVGNLAKMVSPALIGTDVTDGGLAQLRSVTNLSTLVLGGCPRITDSGMAHLRGLTHLSQLDFSGCPQITDVGLVDLKGLHSSAAGCYRPGRHHRAHLHS